MQAVMRSSIYEIFHTLYGFNIPHGLIRTHKWPALNDSGFIARLVRASHQYRKVTASNPVEVLSFSGFHIHNCINCVNNCKDHSLLDTVSMLSKLKYLTKCCFFCCVQFELSHNLHLPTGRPLCNVKLKHYLRVNGRKLQQLGLLYWNYWDLKRKSKEWAMWEGVILVGSEQLGHCHSPTL